MEADPNRFTPLHCAVQNEALEHVRTLLRAGANVNAIAGEGVTPAIVLAATAHAFVFGKPSKSTVARHATRLAIIDELASAGADFDATSTRFHPGKSARQVLRECKIAVP